MSTVFYGDLISPTSLTTYLALPRALLSVSRTTGEIQWLEEYVPAAQLQDTLAAHGQIDNVDLVELKPGEFLMPGFIDTHTVSVHPARHVRTDAVMNAVILACSMLHRCRTLAGTYSHNFILTLLLTGLAITAGSSMSSSAGCRMSHSRWRLGLRTRNSRNRLTSR